MQLFGGMKKKSSQNKQKKINYKIIYKWNQTETKGDEIKIIKKILPPIASNGITFGSVDAPSEVRGCLKVFKRFILRRINYTNESNNKQDINL